MTMRTFFKLELWSRSNGQRKMLLKQICFLVCYNNENLQIYRSVHQLCL